MNEDIKNLSRAGYSYKDAERILLKESSYNRIMAITKYAEQHGAIEVFFNPSAREQFRYLMIADKSQRVMFFTSLEAMSRWIEINVNAGGISIINSLFYDG